MTTAMPGQTIGASPQGKRKARWRAYADLGRVTYLPEVIAQTLAGIALADGRFAPADCALLGAGFGSAYVGGTVLKDRKTRDATMTGGSLLVTSFVAITIAGALHGHALAAAAGAALLAASHVAYDRFHRSAFAPVAMGASRALVYVCAILALRGEISTDAGTAAVAMLAFVTGLSEVTRAPRFSLFALAMLLVAPFLLATLAGASHDVSSLVFVVALGGITALALLHAARGVARRAATTLYLGVAVVDAAVLARFGWLALALAAAVVPNLVAMSKRPLRA
jgi:hypothetical protein